MEIADLLTILARGEDSRHQFLSAAGTKAGLIQMTVPDKPKSRLQRYRLTARGTAVVNASEAR